MRTTLLCMSVLVLSAGVGSTGSRDVPASLSQRIDAFVEPYVEAGYWSGALIVSRGDSMLHRKAYGMANLSHGVANTPETRFQVASVTKAFTAVAAARLWRAGVIDRTSTIDRWLPEFPGADEITIEHLVSHRSGIPDTDDLEWFRLAQARPRGVDALVDSLGAAGLEFEPGSRYSYSNGGYTVLSAVLSAATGLPFHLVLERWVFERAGMAASGDASRPRVVVGMAQGYMPGPDGQLVPGPPAHPSNKIGAGSVYTTIDDVRAFHAALRDGVLLPAAARDSLFGTIDSAFGEDRLYFGGRGPSYTAAIQVYPERNLLVAALGNNYARLNEEITDGVVGLIVGEWTEPRVDAILGRDLPFRGVSVPGSRLDAIAGEYRHQWGFTFTLEREGDRLVYVDPEHGTRSAMIALSDSVYVNPWQWAELRFGSESGFQWLDFPDRIWDLEPVEPSESAG